MEYSWGSDGVMWGRCAPVMSVLEKYLLSVELISGDRGIDSATGEMFRVELYRRCDRGSADILYLQCTLAGGADKC